MSLPTLSWLRVALRSDRNDKVAGLEALVEHPAEGRGVSVELLGRFRNRQGQAIEPHGHAILPQRKHERLGVPIINMPIAEKDLPATHVPFETDPGVLFRQKFCQQNRTLKTRAEGGLPFSWSLAGESLRTALTGEGRAMLEECGYCGVLGIVEGEEATFVPLEPWATVLKPCLLSHLRIVWNCSIRLRSTSSSTRTVCPFGCLDVIPSRATRTGVRPGAAARPRACYHSGRMRRRAGYRCRRRNAGCCSRSV